MDVYDVYIIGTRYNDISLHFLGVLEPCGAMLNTQFF